MGCGRPSSLKAVSPDENNQLVNNTTRLIDNSKIQKPLQQTLQKVIKIQKEDDKNDPLYKLLEKMKNFKKSIELSKGSFSQSFDTLQLIFKNIAKDFSKEKFKKIKKSNKFFKEFIGKYESVVDLISFLGFKDSGNEFVFSESLPKSYVQMRIIDLNIAFNKLSSI